MARVKAILWLHVVRLSRYKYGLVNYILVDIMWYMVFLLGALMFVPASEFREVAIITFWGVVLWSIMNNCVWLIAGWTWFVLATGLVEEHYLHNTNPLLFVSLRLVTGLTVSLATIPLVILVFSSITGETLCYIYNPAYLLLGVLFIIAYATLYSLILAALSFRLQIPGVMLDILNIFMYIGGGIGVPVHKMPDQLRYIALAMPYTHAAEITRYGVLGIEPYLGLYNELAIAVAYLLAIALTAYIIVEKVMEYIRRYGVRAIGMM